MKTIYLNFALIFSTALCFAKGLDSTDLAVLQETDVSSVEVKASWTDYGNALKELPFIAKGHADIFIETYPKLTLAMSGLFPLVVSIRTDSLSKTLLALLLASYPASKSIPLAYKEHVEYIKETELEEK